MDILNETRAFAKLVQTDPRYIKYMAAKIKNDEDGELQNMIQEFNLKKFDLSTEISGEQRDEQKVQSLNTEIETLYHSIMDNENMKDFSDASEELDVMVNQINAIITGALSGENPELIDPEANCGGSCGGCAGCN